MLINLFLSNAKKYLLSTCNNFNIFQCFENIVRKLLKRYVFIIAPLSKILSVGWPWSLSAFQLGATCVLLSLPLSIYIYSCCICVYIYIYSCLFVGLGFELRASCLQSRCLWLEPCLQSICSGYFGDGISWTICLGRPPTIILLLISASQIAKITSMSHQAPGQTLLMATNH
jgi:hypothetical protein